MALAPRAGYEGDETPSRVRPLSNRLSIVIGLSIIAAIVADQAANGGQATLFLGRKFVELIELLAFWR